MARDARPPAWTTLLVVLGTIAIVGGLLYAFADRTPAPDALAEAPVNGSPTPQPTSTATPSESEEPEVSPEGGTPTPTPEAVVEPVDVDVLNQTDQAGLAGRAAAALDDAGWPVRTVDNAAFGTPSTTLYVPDGLEEAGDEFAARFSVPRTAAAFEGLPSDALTLVLAEPDALDVVVELESLADVTGG